MPQAFRKVFSWLQGDPKPDQTDPAQTIPLEENQPPAFDLFPDEVAREERRSMERQELTTDGLASTGMFTLPEPIVVRNFSNRGMYFYLSFKPAVGQLIQVTMVDPELHRKVRYHAKVARTEDVADDRFGIGAAITRREIIDEAA